MLHFRFDFVSDVSNANLNILFQFYTIFCMSGCQKYEVRADFWCESISNRKSLMLELMMVSTGYRHSTVRSR